MLKNFNELSENEQAIYMGIARAMLKDLCIDTTDYSDGEVQFGVNLATEDNALVLEKAILLYTSINCIPSHKGNLVKLDDYTPKIGDKCELIEDVEYVKSLMGHLFRKGDILCVRDIIANKALCSYWSSHPIKSSILNVVPFKDLKIISRSGKLAAPEKLPNIDPETCELQIADKVLLKKHGGDIGIIMAISQDKDGFIFFVFNNYRGYQQEIQCKREDMTLVCRDECWLVDESNFL